MERDRHRLDAAAGLRPPHLPAPQGGQRAQPAMERRTAPAVAVLHVSAGGGYSNGIRKAVADLAAAQAGLGHPVGLHLSGPDSFDGFPPDAGADAVHVVRSPLTGPAAFGFSAAAERWIGSRDAASFGVLHQHGIWPAYSRLTLRWRARHGRPTVVAPHGALQAVALRYSRWKKALALAGYERRNLHEASCLHATSRQEVDSFRDFGLRAPVAVIPNGVGEGWMRSVGDAARFRAAHGLGTRRTILYFSRIHPKKHLLGLAEALVALRERLDDWQLVVAGPVEDQAYATRVRQLVRAGGLDARVHWVGELHGQEKRDAFAAAELMVLPTLSDNFAIVVAESLGVGVPVITTEGALPWFLLPQHRCGWWVPLGTPPLADALGEAMDMPVSRLAEMGLRGRQLMERQFRWSDIARQTTHLYDWLLGRAAQPDFVVVD